MQCRKGLLLPKYPKLTCKPGLKQTRSKFLSIKAAQESLKHRKDPSHAQHHVSLHHLPCFFRGEEMLQILNLRNPFHVLYMSLMIRIVKMEWANKLHNYLQGQESRAWPYQPEILMWNSRKITKHQHFCWMLTVNSSPGSEPQQNPNIAHPHPASVTLVRKLRQLHPPALTGNSFSSSPAVSSLSQEISSPAMHRDSIKNGMLAWLLWTIYWPVSDLAWPSHTHMVSLTWKPVEIQSISLGCFSNTVPTGIR